jgi:hypothetical protein
MPLLDSQAELPGKLKPRNSDRPFPGRADDLSEIEITPEYDWLTKRGSSGGSFNNDSNEYASDT